MKIVADENIPYLQEFFAAMGSIETFPGRSITRQAVSDADILLVRSVTRVNADLLEGSQVRFVGSTTIGLDHIDLDFLDRQQIGFSSAPGSNAGAVVDYVLSALAWLCCDRGLNLFRRCVGIVGMGNTGGTLARRLRAFGIECVCCDPPLARAGQQGLVELDELLDRADVVSLHTPLIRSGRDATFHMLDSAHLAQLRPGTILVNTARGEIIDNAALLQCLDRGSDITAVLDVWEGEPNINLQLVERVALATPHIAGYSLDGKLAGVRQVYHAVCEYLALPQLPAAQQALLDKRTLVVDSGTASPVDVWQACSGLMLAAYNIEADSERLRATMRGNAHAPGTAFDRLRKEYPVRREFSATRLDFSGVQLPDSVIKALGALGFSR